jgi:hypothetical protein
MVDLRPSFFALGSLILRIPARGRAKSTISTNGKSKSDAPKSTTKSKEPEKSKSKPDKEEKEKDVEKSRKGSRDKDKDDKPERSTKRPTYERSRSRNVSRKRDDDVNYLDPDDEEEEKAGYISRSTLVVNTESGPGWGWATDPLFRQSESIAKRWFDVDTPSSTSIDLRAASTFKIHLAKHRQLVRLGIPASARANVWELLIGARTYSGRLENPISYYANLVRQAPSTLLTPRRDDDDDSSSHRQSGDPATACSNARALAPSNVHLSNSSGMNLAASHRIASQHPFDSIDCTSTVVGSCMSCPASSYAFSSNSRDFKSSDDMMERDNERTGEIPVRIAILLASNVTQYDESHVWRRRLIGELVGKCSKDEQKKARMRTCTCTCTSRHDQTPWNATITSFTYQQYIEKIEHTTKHTSTIA